MRYGVIWMFYAWSFKSPEFIFENGLKTCRFAEYCLISTCLPCSLVPVDQLYPLRSIDVHSWLIASLLVHSLGHFFACVQLLLLYLNFELPSTLRQHAQTNTILQLYLSLSCEFESVLLFSHLRHLIELFHLSFLFPSSLFLRL